MTHLKVLPASLMDATRLNMRQADVRELQEFSIEQPVHTLMGSINLSRSAYSVFDSMDRLVCIFGVASHPNNPTVGYPWMLCSDLIGEHRLTALRWARQTLDDWLEHYSLLVNFVHEDNTSAIRWLQLLGAHMEHLVPLGPRLAPFKQFTFRRKT